jgi:lipopolysaccharide/colanic/teichoic acid biosynthesis glycosyltransferase
VLRFFDVLIAFIGLVCLSPVLLLVAFFVFMDSGSPIFYKQNRLGRFGYSFPLIKFRTMVANADSQGLITVGGRDARITKVGYYLRKIKLDEIPQLWNVLIGDMSLVGPRPEVEKYVKRYPKEYDFLLKVRPGVTSLASLKFSNENEILENQPDANQYYEEVLLPEKIAIDSVYVENRSLQLYVSIIGKTVLKVLKFNK